MIKNCLVNDEYIKIIYIPSLLLIKLNSINNKFYSYRIKMFMKNKF